MSSRLSDISEQSESALVNISGLKDYLKKESHPPAGNSPEVHYDQYPHQSIRERSSGIVLLTMIYRDRDIPYDCIFTDVNPLFEHLSGLKAKNLIGKTLRAGMPGIKQEWIDAFIKVALTGKPMIFDTYLNCLESDFEVFAYSPKKNQVTVVFTNISEKSQAEDLLLVSEHNFKNLADNAKNGFLVLSKNGTIAYVNTHFTKMSQYAISELYGKTLKAMLL